MLRLRSRHGRARRDPDRRRAADPRGGGLDRFSAADLGIVVCWDQPDVLPPRPALEALRALARRGGRVLSQRTGAFVLAAAGLLDGRRAAGRPPRYDALAVRRAAREPLSRDRCRSGRALRQRRPGDHQRRHRSRDRRLPAPATAGVRRRRRERGGAPHGGAPAPGRRPGAVRRGCASVRRTTRRTWRPCTSGPLTRGTSPAMCGTTPQAYRRTFSQAGPDHNPARECRVNDPAERFAGEETAGASPALIRVT